MNTRFIRIDIDQRQVATLTLTNAANRNALSPDMIAELTAFAARMTAEPFARVVILKGQGTVFCAGGDLRWMEAQFSATREARISEARKLAYMLKALNELPLPVIGQVHGRALGGGVGMMCVCDSVIAADDTRFGFTETHLGLIPATIGPYVMARVGEGLARSVFMSGELFGTDEAIRLGLVRKAVPAGQLETAAEDEIAPYLKAAPEAVAASKALARSLGPTIDDAVIEDTAQRLADAWETPAARQRVAEFFENRQSRKS